MLIIVATPIGNLGDLSPRASAAFEGADIIACEDTRQTRKLLSLTGIKSTAKLVSYHDHSPPSTVDFLLDALKSGLKIILASDAGTPLISDPGYRLVTACHDHDIKITTIPGPSAPVAALTLSGLPSDRFTFQGFVAAKSSAAKQQIAASRWLDMTQIWLEVGTRLAKTLTLMTDLYGKREAVIAREITKLHEQIDRGRLDELATRYSTLPPPKGEIVLIVEGFQAETSALDEEGIVSLLKQAREASSLKQAVQQVHSLTDWPRKKIYALALDLDQKGLDQQQDTKSK